MTLLVRLLGDRHEAEDAYQETWTALWRTRRRIDPGRDPWPLIRKTALNKAIDGLRRRRREPCVVGGVSNDVAVKESGPGPEIDLASLPRLYRSCLVLHFWEEMSVAEIAAELQVPPGTVKTWMFRARRQLRESLLAKGECR